MNFKDITEKDKKQAKQILGWAPKYTFKKMIDEMIDYWLIKL